MKDSIPVRGSIAGHCYYEQTDRDIVWGSVGFNQGDSDVRPYVGGLSVTPSHIVSSTVNLDHRIIYLRILKPHFAPIVDMYLDLECELSGYNSLKVALTEVDGFEPIDLGQSSIDEQWLAVSGDGLAVEVSGGKIVTSALNLKPLLPAGGSREMFGLVLAFGSNPQAFKFNRIKILLGTEQLK